MISSMSQDGDIFPPRSGVGDARPGITLAGTFQVILAYAMFFGCTVLCQY
jgi:hypothetical protein